MTGRQAVIQSKSKAKITQKKYATSRDQERAEQSRKKKEGKG